MATREENLKKINDELAKLSDDELDKVAGGFCGTDDLYANKIAANPQGGLEDHPKYGMIPLEGLSRVD